MNDNKTIAYLAHLRALPFVKRVQARSAGTDSRLVVETAHGQHAFRYTVLGSHLSKVTAELWSSRARSSDIPLLLMSPYVSDPMGARLREAGLSYVDAGGNVSLTLAGDDGHAQHVALIQGQARTQAQVPDRAWRAESYQVLFTLLAEPALIEASVRAVAARAEVSTTPVLQVRERLIQSGLVSPTKRSLRWGPAAMMKARDVWIAGYHATLRPRLLIHRYRQRSGVATVDAQAELETRLREVSVDWRWGGAAASARVDGYYRSDITVVHVHAPDLSPNELGRILRLVPDPNGSITLLQRPGKAAFQLEGDPMQTKVVHPLLVWAELLEEGNDRASEAAAEWAASQLDRDDHADS
ncbi:MAG: type IV toxin-antitoxin system AbiEi family antitoxin [Polyangiales bacterium]